MKIELKKIAFYERMSEETNAFTADIYINDVKTGYAKNDGQGGCTFYHAYQGKEQLLKEAEIFAKSLPKTKHEFSGKTYEFDSNLESIIDHMFEQYLTAKENAKFAKKREKAYLTSIVFGKPNGTSYRSIGWKQKGITIEFLKATAHGITAIKNAIASAKKECGEGDVILNTNLPKEWIE